MTQSPYYPPAQPPQGYPPQQPPAAYPPQYPQAPQPPAPGYPQAPPAQYPPQPYGQPGYPPQQGYGAPPAPPQQPLAQGGLDEFYSQPATGGGPGISWSDPNGNQLPVGTTFIGVVTKDCGDPDISQITNLEGVPQTYRDGRPKFQMKVPLRNVAMYDGQGNQQQLPAKFTDGEAVFYVKGQAREELTRAMAEAQRTGAPTKDSVISVQLVQRRGNGGGINPTNVVAIRYQPGDSGQPAQPAQVPVQQPPTQAPVPEQVPQLVQQPPAAYATPAGPPQPTPSAGPVYQVPPQAPQPGYADPTMPPPNNAGVQAQPGYPPQAVPQQAPVQQGQPQWSDPGQAALFAKITGQPAPQQPAPQQPAA